jgi:hypothetical protein
VWEGRNLATFAFQAVTPRFAELLLYLFACENQMVVTLHKASYEWVNTQKSSAMLHVKINEKPSKYVLLTLPNWNHFFQWLTCTKAKRNQALSMRLSFAKMDSDISTGKKDNFDLVQSGAQGM